MMLILFFLLISNAKVYSDDDVYISNSFTTYSKIPTDCNLFGNKFEADYPVHKLTINTTKNGTYWVGAKIGFKRNINPLGFRADCTNSYNGSLDDCNRKCNSWKYFKYNDHSCDCLNDYKTSSGFGLANTDICERENGLCHKKRCAVYERNVWSEDFLCDAFFFDQINKDWKFTTQNCSLKLSFVCDEDKEPASDSSSSSWLEAEHRCSEKGKHLLRTNKDLGVNFRNGTKYWVSFFRRKKILWGKDITKTVCVVARFQENGSYSLKSHFCNESLKALCHRPEDNNGSFDAVDVVTASGSAGGVVVFLVGIIAVIYKKRRGLPPNIQTPPQEDFNISSTSTGRIMIKGIDEPLYSNSDDPVGDLSIYSLAKDYSEPGNNKDTPDKQYDSVTYKEPRKTDEDKHYDHIMENYYQNPYS